MGKAANSSVQLAVLTEELPKDTVPVDKVVLMPPQPQQE
jgi:hypothetical protein